MLVGHHQDMRLGVAFSARTHLLTHNTVDQYAASFACFRTGCNLSPGLGGWQGNIVLRNVYFVGLVSMQVHVQLAVGM